MSGAPDPAPIPEGSRAVGSEMGEGTAVIIRE
jgi:hypothetical protein